jgi:hypothetical protein
MSEIMLHGVLNMPAEMWHKDSAIDNIQRESRYIQASKLIYEQADKIAELEKRNSEILNRVAEAETRMLAAVLGSTGAIEDCKKSMGAHNLEQRANALSEYAYSHKPLTKRGLNLESIALTDQANALKEKHKNI